MASIYGGGGFRYEPFSTFLNQMVRMMVKQCPSYPAIIITVDWRIRLYQNVKLILQMYRSKKPSKKGYKVSARYICMFNVYAKYGRCSKNKKMKWMAHIAEVLGIRVVLISYTWLLNFSKSPFFHNSGQYMDTWNLY